MSRKWEREKRKRRRKYEFSGGVKNAVEQRSQGLCERCKQSKAIEFHHITSVGEARQMKYGSDYISSAENCLHVCYSCHQMLD